jgi:hypothetical protein
MRFARLIVLTGQMAFGFFLLGQGIDSLKAEHFGIHLLTVQWLANATTLSYHMAGIICLALGIVLMFTAAMICHRGDKRIVAANPGMAPSNTIVFVVLVANVFAFAGWAIVNKWFPARMM